MHQKYIHTICKIDFSAGVGRTGAYIAIDSLLEQAKQEDQVDVFGFTALMRSNRVNMIQTVVSVYCVLFLTRFLMVIQGGVSKFPAKIEQESSLHTQKKMWRLKTKPAFDLRSWQKAKDKVNCSKFKRPTHEIWYFLS